jgi:two-component system sensor histidine kinase DctS
MKQEGEVMNLNILTNMRIHWKITILSFGIVLFSTLMGGLILLGSMARLQERELGQRLIITARTVAELPEIRNRIQGREGIGGINSIASRIQVINDITYIIVMDMNRVKLSHPNPKQIGTVFQGEGGDPAFAEHSYLSKVQGEMGVAIRAYVPVMNENHEQIGVVMAGRLLPSITDMLMRQRGSLLATLFFLSLFGVWGSWFLAKHIKKQMFNLEPQEISRILLERTAAFQSMHEGVIAIDKDGSISIFNDRAKEIFKIPGDVIGKNIRDILPDTRLPDALGHPPVYNQELSIGNAVIMTSRIPIRMEGKTVGALAVFQDRTEVTRLAEELTGVTAFVDALRVQNHEHMNKLHTIGGLLQLGKVERALDYLFEITEQQEELTMYLTKRIDDPNLSGLLLSKISRGKELGVKVTMDRSSRLRQFPELLDHHDFVVLLGNLIENAFDALKSVRTGDKTIDISMDQDEKQLSVMIEDNGPGMHQDVKERMFERGFSTKEGHHRGIGLYLVNQIVHKGNGAIRCDSTPGRGTMIEIIFPMKREGVPAEYTEN